MGFFKTIWEQTRKTVSGIFTKEKKEESPKIPWEQKPPGLDCPSCNFRMTVTIEMLLSRDPIVCPACNLKLNVDREQSKRALDAAQRLHNAMKKVEEVKGGEYSK